MKKMYFLVCAISLGFIACEVTPSADETASATVQNTESTHLSRVVPKEKALANLADALAAIDGQTRAGKSRTVQRVTAVTRADLGLPVTRGEGSPTDSLVYLVEFENSEGSAILGADARLEPIISIYDEYVVVPEDLKPQRLDPEAWRTPENLYCEEDDDYYLGASDLPELPIENTMLEKKLIYDYIYQEAEDTGGAVHTEEGKWVLRGLVRPMLATQWHQNPPFDKLTPHNYPAGCVAIAVAQIMAYHEFPRDYCNWSLAKTYHFKNNSTDEAVNNSLAALSATIGRGCKYRVS